MEVPGSLTLSLKEQIINTDRQRAIQSLSQYAALPPSAEVDADHRQMKGHCSVHLQTQSVGRGGWGFLGKCWPGLHH